MTTPIGSDGGAGTSPSAHDMNTTRPVPLGTGEELLQQVIMMLDEQRSQSRAARAAGRDISRQQARERIGKMREAAHFELAASVVKGTAAAASGAMGKTEAGSTTQAAGSTDAAVLGWFAAQADADAEQAGLRSQIASDGADDAGGYMQESAQRLDRALQKLDAILQAEVDASRAAIRRG